MALLKKHTNSELQQLYSDAVSRGTTAEKLLNDFGKPPFHFIGPQTGPVRRYNDFTATHVDREGLEYSRLEEKTHFGVRIRRTVRKKNPMITFPQPGETIQILKLQSGKVLELYVVSLHVNRTRSATGWIEVSV